MWNRKDVKEKGKTAFKANFWKCILAAIILAIVFGGVAGSSGGGGMFKVKNSNKDTDSDNSVVMFVGDEDNEQTKEVDPQELFEDAVKEEFGSVDKDLFRSLSVTAIVVIAIVGLIAALIILAIAVVIKALIFNPIELGCKRFFRKNLDEPAQMSNVMFAFDSNYKSIAKTLFMRDLYTFLWSLLLIIPGIVKVYEYRMIPYLLSENPEMSMEDAFAESKRLMTGNKWRAFVYDLSFILWYMLSAITLGIVGIFYVNPYKASSDAALYEAIKYGTANP